MPASTTLRVAARTLAAAATLALCACSTTPKAPPTLYERLGGTPKLELVVARLIDRAAADPQTRRRFAGMPLAPLKRSLVQQLCQVSGGGCLFDAGTGPDAARALNINDDEFHALAVLLREELDRAHVPPSAKNDLLRVLAPMRRDLLEGVRRRA